MAITTGTMTDEQRKSVALEYLKAFAAIVGVFAIMRMDATIRWYGSWMSVESW